METLWNIILFVVGLLAVRYIMLEILVHPAIGIAGIVALAIASINEGIFQSLFMGSWEAKFMGIGIVAMLVGFLTMQVTAWRKDGAFARMIPRMFPVF